jgi:hypothetical protein
MTEGAHVAGIDLPRLVKDRDRHGTSRYYVRAKNVGKVRLRGAPGSSEFLGEYQAALEKLGISEVGASAEGTWKWLCQRYMASPEFGLLDARTRRVRRAIIEKTWTEPMTPGSTYLFATCPVSRMTAKHIRVLRDRKAEHPEAANGKLKAVR